MEEQSGNVKRSKWTSLLRFLLVGAVVAFISFLFPNNVTFKYEFEARQSWRYDDLYAPFDFAILKTAEELRKDQEALDANFTPYYSEDAQIAKQAKSDFEASFNQLKEEALDGDLFKDVKRKPDDYLRYGQQFLNKIYDRGVIEMDSSLEQKGNDFVLNIVRGNTTYLQTLGNLYTIAAAKSLLSDSLPYSPLKEPEFLFPILQQNVHSNLVFNDTLTQKFRTDLLAEISGTRGMVMKGELIIPRDGIVTEEIYQTLTSYKRFYEEEVTEKKSHWIVFAGYFLLTSIIVGVFLLYLQFYATSIYHNLGELIFFFIWLVMYSYLVYLVEQLGGLSAYMIPFCIIPIVINTFYNEQLALFTHIIVVLIASFLSSLGYEFTFLQILAGIVVLLGKINTQDWSRFFYSMLFLFLSYGLGYLGLSLIQEGGLQTIDWSVYSWLFFNVVFTLLAFPLVPLLERVFSFFTSPLTLMELSDLNKPLLQALALKAPGTLQHSLQVANLSEAAARRVGANPLLVKVAALYHDIGKTDKPAFYIENQSGKNPHDDISDLESAKIIIAHVTEGVKMASKAKLPQVLIDFIKSHHGTTRVEYFYRKHLAAHPEHNFDETLFVYPGPLPKSKEETILMMADSVEAACKSLKNPTEKDLMDLIDKIIEGKITHGQLEESEMNFKELEACRQVFKQVMKSVHHVRIEYPVEKKGVENKEDTADQG